VDFKNGSPSHSLVEAIMTNELVSYFQNERSRQFLPKSEPVSATAF
ncbi:6838_t:CDS:1, partial [Dentiscutata heterogama]